MIAISGKTVHPGIAAGPICLYRRCSCSHKKASQLSPQEELSRFRRASLQAGEQLRQLQETSSCRIGQDLAAIFQVQAAILEDPDFITAAEGRIQRGDSAEHAAIAAGEDCAQMLLNTGDSYLCARAADARDLAHRVAAILSGQQKSPLSTPGILIAEELSPSEAVSLDTRGLLGLVSCRGASNSHTAILARAMGIPSLTGVELSPDWEGRMAVLDGDNGRLYIDPDEATLSAALERQQQLQQQRELLLRKVKQPCQTKDGYPILLCANIGSPQEAADARRQGCQGIGLFRSEYLYLGRDTCPTEEEQFIAYQQTVLAMEGMPVVVRTLDVGADKHAPCLPHSQQSNPALGFRGIRYSLSHPDLFCQQLRAILRAAAFGPMAVMFPLVTRVDEIRQAKAMLDQCRRQLEQAGVPYGPLEIGTMIETPAAVIIADDLGQEVDFFSLGTNDLTQYTLVADRQDPQPESVYDPRHPALLRMILHTIESGHRCGCWVGLCGELASDPEMTQQLLTMGLDELSVSPSALLTMRENIQNLTLGQRNCE